MQLKLKAVEVAERKSKEAGELASCSIPCTN